MTEHPQHPERRIRKWRPRDGFTPGYKAFHEVHITKDLGPERNEELVTFINKHIIEFKGKTEDKHGIPQMLFERKQDTQKFANELGARLSRGEYVGIDLPPSLSIVKHELRDRRSSRTFGHAKPVALTNPSSSRRSAHESQTLSSRY